MKIEQIYTGCLAQGAYYIESNGEAAIVDPLRETKPYLDKAAKEGAKIKYIFETHFHADFVSGHVSLAEETGATIVFGPTAQTTYEAHIAEDGEVFSIGDIKIKVLHTPGHTTESSTFLVTDEKGKDVAIFSGDTLFIGDVGRPDLAVKSDLSREDLAGLLFDSLRNKIMPLADDVIVYPAHGAGSACGKNMSKETSDTLGNQKATNYALRADMTRDEFIKEVTDGLTTPPQYFPKNVKMNKEGYENIDSILERGNIGLNPNLFEEVVNAEGALMLDTRSPQVFKDGFIPNSINIGVKGGFAPWVGALILDLKQPIVIIADEGTEEEVITRLSRVGYDNTLGFLEGGIAAWEAAGKEVDSIESISAEELKDRLKSSISVIDARKTSEYTSEHINNENVVNKPLDVINEEWNDLDKNATYYIHCAGGYRSMIASSIMKSRGFDHIIDVKGGFKAIKEAGIDVTAFVCPSTL
ncbi:MBL fold metallo-hydrolase [Flammeovirga kamogawensis]|uniref:MBL fold metallo-hydrolase n=1 Tax=Flammeovirga kamogawensis TaxID=373891 RepID=A0ABX8GVF2_9BACT|nr:MBL fold metallo-hydrolase [Flammeovirga kamogawensis]MBB6460998.1 glyoxylase-like metal-dependent hydrolase (beta-lactamase superfamily II)/rhodanese-related sulfurtransferase [Flammeovirga kamogawensis]QWG07570.1 MBL fold metallo-hydrolase [Flammeovirga kamogawensis]TRX69382.1 MBL fold metallo-hydrolase [Flammeovirga kamogawensis]